MIVTDDITKAQANDQPANGDGIEVLLLKILTMLQK
jgi:hypothetical protein